MNAGGIALVTGSSRGIGRAVALALARRGFEVIATMRNPSHGQDLVAEASAAGGTLRLAELDVRKPDTIRIPDGLRVLMNNAGIEGEHLAVEDTPLDQWRRMFETNVLGLIETTRRALPALRASGGGVVCNLTSSSLLFPVPFYATYRASKAAVSAVGESLRAEVAGQGIRVLEILPGPIDTDMLAHSDRLPEAARHETYRALAERSFAQRRGIDSLVTPAPRAGEAIVDGILDDDAPLRLGCDPLSIGTLDAWRAGTDEELMQGFLAALYETGGNASD